MVKQCLSSYLATIFCPSEISNTIDFTFQTLLQFLPVAESSSVVRRTSTSMANIPSVIKIQTCAATSLSSTSISAATKFTSISERGSIVRATHPISMTQQASCQVHITKVRRVGSHIKGKEIAVE